MTSNTETFYSWYLVKIDKSERRLKQLKRIKLDITCDVRRVLELVFQCSVCICIMLMLL